MPKQRRTAKKDTPTGFTPTGFTGEQPAVAARTGESLEVLERGTIDFLYRPAVAEAAPHGVADVRRFYLVLRPAGEAALRWIVVGHKKLPEATEAGGRFWGFVDGVGPREDLAEALAGTRPAGEGAYALVRHRGHAHLAYALTLPARPGVVQHDLNIAGEASYLLVAKNPQATSPPGMGLDGDRKVELPAALQAAFGDRRFMPLADPALLDHAGLELLLVGTDEDLEAEFGFTVEAGSEGHQPADVIAALRLAAADTPTTPLTDGTWA